MKVMLLVFGVVAFMGNFVSGAVAENQGYVDVGIIKPMDMASGFESRLRYQEQLELQQQHLEDQRRYEYDHPRDSEGE